MKLYVDILKWIFPLVYLNVGLLPLYLSPVSLSFSPFHGRHCNQSVNSAQLADIQLLFFVFQNNWKLIFSQVGIASLFNFSNLTNSLHKPTVLTYFWVIDLIEHSFRFISLRKTVQENSKVKGIMSWVLG